MSTIEEENSHVTTAFPLSSSSSSSPPSSSSSLFSSSPLSSSSSSNSDAKCSVCLEYFSDIESTPLILIHCAHSICSSCLDELFKNKEQEEEREEKDKFPTCPVCRTIIYKKQYAKTNISLVHSLEVLKQERKRIREYEEGIRKGKKQKVEYQQKNSYNCASTISKGKRCEESISTYCFHCNLYYCEDHEHDETIVKDHQMIRVEELSIICKSKHIFNKCGEHNERIHLFYCTKCKMECCDKCKIENHLHHSILSLVDSIKQSTIGKLEKQLEASKDMLKTYACIDHERKKELKQWKRKKDECNKIIHANTQKIIQAIEQRRDELIQQANLEYVNYEKELKNKFSHSSSHLQQHLSLLKRYEHAEEDKEKICDAMDVINHLSEMKHHQTQTNIDFSITKSMDVLFDVDKMNQHISFLKHFGECKSTHELHIPIESILSYKSPPFDVNGSKWCFQFTHKKENNLSLCLIYQSPSTKAYDMEVFYSFRIIHPDEKKNEDESGKRKITNIHSKIESKTMYNIDKLKNVFLHPNNQLFIRIEAKILKEF